MMDATDAEALFYHPALLANADGFGDALALLASGALPTELLIEPDDVPLDGLFDALCELERQERAGKVMIVPRLQTED